MGSDRVEAVVRAIGAGAGEQLERIAGVLEGAKLVAGPKVLLVELGPPRPSQRQVIDRAAVLGRAIVEALRSVGQRPAILFLPPKTGDPACMALLSGDRGVLLEVGGERGVAKAVIDRVLDEVWAEVKKPVEERIAEIISERLGVPRERVLVSISTPRYLYPETPYSSIVGVDLSIGVEAMGEVLNLVKTTKPLILPGASLAVRDEGLLRLLSLESGVIEVGDGSFLAKRLLEIAGLRDKLYPLLRPMVLLLANIAANMRRCGGERLSVELYAQRRDPLGTEEWRPLPDLLGAARSLEKGAPRVRAVLRAAGFSWGGEGVRSVKMDLRASSRGLVLRLFEAEIVARGGGMEVVSCIGDECEALLDALRSGEPVRKLVEEVYPGLGEGETLSIFVALGEGRAEVLVSAGSTMAVLKASWIDGLRLLADLHRALLLHVPSSVERAVEAHVANILGLEREKVKCFALTGGTVELAIPGLIGSCRTLAKLREVPMWIEVMELRNRPLPVLGAEIPSPTTVIARKLELLVDPGDRELLKKLVRLLEALSRAAPEVLGSEELRLALATSTNLGRGAIVAIGDALRILRNGGRILVATLREGGNRIDPLLEVGPNLLAPGDLPDDIDSVRSPNRLLA